jgi:hypothetical protein
MRRLLLLPAVTVADDGRTVRGSPWLAVFFLKEFLFVSSQNGDHQFGGFFTLCFSHFWRLKTS